MELVIMMMKDKTLQAPPLTSSIFRVNSWSPVNIGNPKLTSLLAMGAAPFANGAKLAGSTAGAVASAGLTLNTANNVNNKINQI